MPQYSRGKQHNEQEKSEGQFRISQERFAGEERGSAIGLNLGAHVK